MNFRALLLEQTSFCNVEVQWSAVYLSTSVWVVISAYDSIAVVGSSLHRYRF